MAPLTITCADGVKVEVPASIVCKFGLLNDLPEGDIDLGNLKTQWAPVLSTRTETFEIRSDVLRACIAYYEFVERGNYGLDKEETDERVLKSLRVVARVRPWELEFFGPYLIPGTAVPDYERSPNLLHLYMVADMLDATDLKGSLGRVVAREMERGMRGSEQEFAEMAQRNNVPEAIKSAADIVAVIQKYKST